MKNEENKERKDNGIRTTGPLTIFYLTKKSPIAYKLVLVVNIAENCSLTLDNNLR
jgi:hypothetical protein